MRFKLKAALILIVTAIMVSTAVDWLRGPLAQVPDSGPGWVDRTGSGAVEDTRPFSIVRQPESSAATTEVDELKREEEEIGAIIRDAGSVKSHSQGLAWPLPKNRQITSPFGMRKHPLLGVDVLHAGIDIAAAEGVSVRACGDGTVIAVTTLQDYGTVVIISHGDKLATVYAHLSQVSVAKGQSVTAGDIIGRTGQTGNVTGPHLHLEVRVAGEPVDPLAHVRPPE